MVSIPSGPFVVHAEEKIPRDARGLVMFVGGATDEALGQAVVAMVEILSSAGFATLHVPPISSACALPPSELVARQHYDLHRAVQCLLAATDWHITSDLSRLPLAYVGVGPGVPAVLHAAAARVREVAAVAVIDGGTELAARDLLERVEAPTLCISNDARVLSESMLGHLQCEHAHARVPGPHPLHSSEALEETTERIREWLHKHMRARPLPRETAWQRNPQV
jgi:hypothetical protein